MGRTHATSGTVAFLAVLPILPWVGVEASTPTTVVGALAAAGGAVLPDLDDPQATVCRSLGPVTAVLSAAVAAVSGGHRQATHSALGVAVFTVFTWFLTLAQTTAGRALLRAWLTLLFVAAAAALQLPGPRVLRLAVGVAGALLLVRASTGHTFAVEVVVWAVMIGSASHIIGDLLTREGCPLLWPASHRRQHLMSLTTDGWAERVVIGPALAVVAVLLTIRQAGGLPALAAALASLGNLHLPT